MRFRQFGRRRFPRTKKPCSADPQQMQRSPWPSAFLQIRFWDPNDCTFERKINTASSCRVSAIKRGKERMKEKL